MHRASEVHHNEQRLLVTFAAQRHPRGGWRRRGYPTFYCCEICIFFTNTVNALIRLSTQPEKQ
jgi:hypothetical protein